MSLLWYFITDAVALVLLVWIIEDCLVAIGVDPPIPGLKLIPHYPIVGSLMLVRSNPARVYMKWARFYRCHVFQVRLGFRNVVVANSYLSVDFLWGKCASANNSRPTLSIFHGIVSQSQGFTIGSTPASASLLRTKRAASLELNGRSVRLMANKIDTQVRYMLRMVIKNNVELGGPPSVFVGHVRNRVSDVDLLPYFQLFALRSAIQLTYGTTLDCYGKHAQVCQEIISVENQIIRLRGQGSWVPDFLPFTKAFGNWTARAAALRLRRDRYMNELSRTFNRRFMDGEADARNSILGNLYSSSSLLSQREINSICLTMVSAGLDNTPFTINHLMGHLSRSDYGYTLQKTALSAIISTYGSYHEAWAHCGDNIDCAFVLALLNETLRFFTVLPLSLPRRTTKDVKYAGVIIPAGTALYMNAYAANHDPAKFPDPYTFDPFRWFVPGTMVLKPRKELDHFTFGAGSRKCSGSILAMQEMYTIACRMMLVFRIRRPIEEPMELDPFVGNSCPSATSFEPRRFKVRLEPRCCEGSEVAYMLLQR